MATVTLENVSKTYAGERPVLAVRSVSLDIADREFVVLVGPSGCGKSTTLRMIYHQPWEEVEPSRTFELSVTVTE